MNQAILNFTYRLETAIRILFCSKSVLIYFGGKRVKVGDTIYLDDLQATFKKRR